MSSFLCLMNAELKGRCCVFQDEMTRLIDSVPFFFFFFFFFLSFSPPPLELLFCLGILKDFDLCAGCEYVKDACCVSYNKACNINVPGA